MNKCINCSKITSNKKFCSLSCSTSYNNQIRKKNPIINRCAQCNKDTINPKFCCQSCSATYSNYKKIPKKYYCIKCGAFICQGWQSEKNKKYCKECNPNYKNWNNITLKEFKKNRPNYQTHSRLRSIARSLYKKSGKPQYCQGCGWKYFYEICHIKSCSEFNDDNTIGEINHLDNLIALCPNCHWLLDHKVPISGVAPEH